MVMGMVVSQSRCPRLTVLLVRLALSLLIQQHIFSPKSAQLCQIRVILCSLHLQRSQISSPIYRQSRNKEHNHGVTVLHLVIDSSMYMAPKGEIFMVTGILGNQFNMRILRGVDFLHL